MTINKIYGNKGIVPLDKTRGADKAKVTESKTGSAAGDKVQFSDVLQQVNQAKGAEVGSDVERAEKIQALKEQIAAGTYRPDSTKVAASLLKFIAGNK